jgi:hypothetical protein
MVLVRIRVPGKIGRHVRSRAAGVRCTLIFDVAKR